MYWKSQRCPKVSNLEENVLSNSTHSGFCWLYPPVSFVTFSVFPIHHQFNMEPSLGSGSILWLVNIITLSFPSHL